MSTAVYLIFGDDEFLAAAKAKQTVDALVAPEDRAFGLETIDGNADTVDAAVAIVSRCIESLQTPGLLGGRKVVWLRDADFLAETVTGKSERVRDAMTELAGMIKSGLLAGQTLLVSALKVSKKYTFYKTCKALGEVHEFAVPDKAWASEKLAQGRLQELLKKAGLRMHREVAAAFLEKVGTDTRQIVNEVGKMALFLGGEHEVRLEDVEAVTSFSRGAIAWDLADSVGARDLSRAVTLVRQLLFQKESPIRLVSSIGGRIRELMIYREAMDKGWLRVQKREKGTSAQWGELPPEAEAAFGAMARNPRSVHPYRAAKLAEQASLFTAGSLRKCQAAVIAAHGKLVSTRLPKPTVLELLLVEILS